MPPTPISLANLHLFSDEDSSLLSPKKDLPTPFPYKEEESHDESDSFRIDTSLVDLGKLSASGPGRSTKTQNSVLGLQINISTPPSPAVNNRNPKFSQNYHSYGSLSSSPKTQPFSGGFNQPKSVSESDEERDRLEDEQATKKYDSLNYAQSTSKSSSTTMNNGDIRRTNQTKAFPDLEKGPPLLSSGSNNSNSLRERKSSTTNSAVNNFHSYTSMSSVNYRDNSPDFGTDRTGYEHYDRHHNRPRKYSFSYSSSEDEMSADEDDLLHQARRGSTIKDILTFSYVPIYIAIFLTFIVCLSFSYVFGKIKS